MSNHTPGPWEFVNGRIISRVTNDDINHLVDDATYEANERLKARAPELLEENKRLREKMLSMKAESALAAGRLKPDIEDEIRAVCRDEAHRIIDEIVSLKLVINELLTDLPNRRDWLDPHLEHRLREAVKTTQLEIEAYGKARSGG
jgi:hypothetical protein